MLIFFLKYLQQTLLESQENDFRKLIGFEVLLIHFRKICIWGKKKTLDEGCIWQYEYLVCF